MNTFVNFLVSGGRLKGVTPSCSCCSSSDNTATVADLIRTAERLENQARILREFAEKWPNMTVKDLEHMEYSYIL